MTTKKTTFPRSCALPKLFAPAFAALALSACSVEKYVDDARDELAKEHAAEPCYETLEIREMSWTEALAFADRHNLELRKARNEIRSARRNVKRVFLQLVPLVNLGYYYNKALVGNGAGYYSENYDYNANIIFNIPALTRLPVDYYLAEFALFRAEKNLEIKRREIFSKIFQAARDAETGRRAYALERAAIFGSAAESRRTELDRKREIEVHEEWMTLAALFSDASRKWRVVPAGAEAVSAADFSGVSAQIDPLVLTLMATELEASRLALLGVKINYFPTVQVNFYSPSLFNYSGGTNSGFTGRGEDLRMQLDFFLQLDTRLNTWFSLQEAKENHSVLESALKLKMIERREKMRRLTDACRAYADWRSATEKYDAFLNRRGEVSADAILERERASLAARREMLAQEKAETERVAALMLEYGHAAFPPLFTVEDEDAAKKTAEEAEQEVENV